MGPVAQRSLSLSPEQVNVAKKYFCILDFEIKPPKRCDT